MVRELDCEFTLMPIVGPLGRRLLEQRAKVTHIPSILDSEWWHQLPTDFPDTVLVWEVENDTPVNCWLVDTKSSMKVRL